MIATVMDQPSPLRSVEHNFSYCYLQPKEIEIVNDGFNTNVSLAPTFAQFDFHLSII